MEYKFTLELPSEWRGGGDRPARLMIEFTCGGVFGCRLTSIPPFSSMSYRSKVLLKLLTCSAAHRRSATLRKKKLRADMSDSSALSFSNESSVVGTYLSNKPCNRGEPCIARLDAR